MYRNGPCREARQTRRLRPLLPSAPFADTEIGFTVRYRRITGYRRETRHMASITLMSPEVFVKLGGIDEPALYADASGHLIQANRAAVDLLGPMWESVAESLVDQVATQGDLEEAHHCLAYGAEDGAARSFAVHLFRDEHGCRLMLVNEEMPPDLIPSAKLEEILESIRDSFFAIDGRGEFVYANSHAADFLGVAKQELLGREVEPFRTNHRWLAEAYDKAMVAREATNYDSRLDGENSWIEVRAYPAGDGMAVYFSDITDRVRVQEQVSFLALHDALTRLPNRRYFQEQLKNAVAKSKRGVPCALLFLDMDRFKAVNDTVGHAAGDEVLVQFAEVVTGCARETDTFARFGGDEFALLLDNTPLDEAQDIAQRIQAGVGEHVFTAGGRTFSLGVSIGLAPVRGAGAGGHAMALADSAMYEAKRRGGDQICVMTEQPDSSPAGVAQG
jgi:diguanylate cyclase (GGDEF)-like protein/PAS domain S-box-containing protein